jgi:hypothetical protein
MVDTSSVKPLAEILQKSFKLEVVGQSVVSNRRSAGTIKDDWRQQRMEEMTW